MESTEPQVQQERVRGEVPRTAGGGSPIDYWYDMTEPGGPGGVKQIQTFAYGLLIDTRDNSSDPSKDWGALVAETAPLIQADIDAYGLG